MDNLENKFVTYKKFNSLLEADELINLLEQNDINYIIENASPNIDITFSANRLQDEFRVRIQHEDFEKVNELLSSNISLDQDHFIHEFSIEELIEVLKNPDEWSPEIQHIAKTLLTQKNPNFNVYELESWKQEKIDSLKQTQSEPVTLIRAALFLCVLGGFSCMFVGWYLNNHLKTIFTGERVYVYDEETRNKGKRLLKIGVIVHVLTLVLYLLFLFLPRI